MYKRLLLGALIALVLLAGCGPDMCDPQNLNETLAPYEDIIGRFDNAAHVAEQAAAEGTEVSVSDMEAIRGELDGFKKLTCTQELRDATAAYMDATIAAYQAIADGESDEVIAEKFDAVSVASNQALAKFATLLLKAEYTTE